MARKRIELQAGVTVEIAAAEDDLVIRGLAEPVLLIESSQAEFDLQQEAGRVVLNLREEASLQVWREAPVIIQEIHGDLSVRGLSSLLDIRRADGDISLAEVGAVRLAQVEGDVSVDRAASVSGQGCLNGDVVLRQTGAVELTEVTGDLAASQVAALALDRVADDVSARAIAGAVRMKEVRGDVTLRDVEGAVEMGRVGGDLSVRDLRNDLAVTRVDGDISLHIPFLEGHRYSLAGRKEIVVRLLEGTAARFTIQSPRWTYPSGKAFQVEQEERGRVVVRVGQGGPEVFLAADDRVVLGMVAADWERSFQEFGRRMEEWGDELRRRLEAADWGRVGREVEEATSRIAQLVETRLQEIDVEEIARRAGEASAERVGKVKEVDWDRIGRKVERATRHGMHRVYAGLERLQERLRRRAGGMVPPVPQEPAARPEGPVPPPPPPSPEAAPPTAPAAAAQEVSDAAALDEERMAVLRLVEEGRLTADEAAIVLDALEGGVD